METVVQNYCLGRNPTTWPEVVAVSVDTRELAVEVNVEDDSDAEELAQLAARLQAELFCLDVQSVTSIPDGRMSESSKGVSLLATGGLLVRFLGRQETLQSIIDSVRLWLGRQHARSIKLTLDGDSLELSRVSTAEQEQLIELWMMRHNGPS